MTRTNKIVSVTAAAMGGLLAGSAAFAATPAPTLASSAGFNSSAGVKTVQLDDSTTQPAELPKHDCKGMNSCKGQGGCGSSDNGCRGMNSCKGKGGCNTNPEPAKGASSDKGSDNGGM